MQRPAVRVLVVDDFEKWRRLVCVKLQEMPGLQVIGEASDGSDAVEKAQRLQPDLVLVDVGLPIRNGIEVARQIRKNSRKPKIVFFSENHSREVIEEALHSGASGYVIKSNAESDLIPAVRAALAGEQFVSNNLTTAGVCA
jgi:DNA-binding NarL/FixJ family response regulator